MLTLAENPPQTWPVDAELADAAGSWRAVYVKPRQEKALAWDLNQQEIPYFLPMRLREASSGGRRRRNLYPLFPSYVFVAGDESAREAIYRSGRVVQIIEAKPAEQGQLVAELANLKRCLEANPTSLEFLPAIQVGVAVRVTSGPLAGIEGVVTHADRKTKLCLSVSTLGVGASVEIDADLVEKL